MERRRFSFGLDPIEGREAFACFDELFIKIDGIFRCQQCINDADLNGTKPKMFSFRDTQTCEQAVLCEPFFWKNSERPIVQYDRSITTRQSCEEFRERDSSPFKIHIAMQFKPVNSRFHLEFQIYCLPYMFAISPNLPAFGHQFPDGGCEIPCGDFRIVGTPFLI